MTADEHPSGMPRSYFDSMYRDEPDPWDFDTAWYERRKRDITMALLPDERYRRALEPGCANGALTERLAARCDALVAFDFVDDVVQRARQRLAGRTNVEVRQESFPTYWPPDTGDLVVWSEIAYYLDVHGARKAIEGLNEWLDPNGVVVAVHYTGATNYPRTGRAISTWLDRIHWLDRVVTVTEQQFEAGVWRKHPRSVRAVRR